MNTITVQLPQERIEMLKERAGRMGVSIEDLVCIGIDEILNRSNDSYQDSPANRAESNSELYRRLL